MSRFLLRTRLAVLTPVFALLISATQLWAADAIPSERRLGTDVVAYLSVRNVSELATAWGQTQLGQLLHEKELQPFLKQFEAPYHKFVEEFEKEAGIPLNDILAVPHGELSLAVVHSTGKQMGLVAFLNYGEHQDTVDKLLEKLNKLLTEDDKAKRSEEEVEGTQAVVYTFPAPESSDDEEEKDKKKPATPNTLVYFHKDSTLVFASRVDLVKSVLTRWDGQHERIFADKAAYKYIKEKCRGENAEAVPHLTFFLDPIGITKGAMAMGGADSAASTMILGTLPTLGLDKLKGIGGTFDMGADDFDTVSRVLIYVEPPPSGVLNAFQFPVKDLTPPKWVAATCSTYAAVNWDIAAAYNTVETLYDTFAGQGALGKIVDDLAEQEDGPKIHIKKDLIDHVTGGIVVVGSVPDQADVLAGERYLVGLELKDEAPLRKLLGKLADLEGFPGKVREFEGEKIVEFPTTEDEEDKKEAPYHPAAAITKKYLMFATHVQELEGLLRSDKDRESLSDSDAWKLVAKRFPEQTSSLSFQRSDAQLKLIYEALKSGALTEALSQGDSDFKLDTSSLPEFDVLKKYFQPSGGYMKPDERGWFIMSFSLKGAKAE